MLPSPSSHGGVAEKLQKASTATQNSQVIFLILSGRWRVTGSGCMPALVQVSGAGQEADCYCEQSSSTTWRSSKCPSDGLSSSPISTIFPRVSPQPSGIDDGKWAAIAAASSTLGGKRESLAVVSFFTELGVWKTGTGSDFHSSLVRKPVRSRAPGQSSSGTSACTGADGSTELAFSSLAGDVGISMEGFGSLPSSHAVKRRQLLLHVLPLRAEEASTLQAYGLACSVPALWCPSCPRRPNRSVQTVLKCPEGSRRDELHAAARSEPRSAAWSEPRPAARSEPPNSSTHSRKVGCRLHVACGRLC